MKAFYNLTQKMNAILNSNPLINSVTYGNIFEVDFDKQSIFPIAHMDIGTARFAGNTMTLDVSVAFLDIVSDSTGGNDIKMNGSNNTHDILNTGLAVMNMIVEELRRGDSYSDGFQLSGEPTAEPFLDEYQNMLAGWNLTMTIQLQNDASIC